MKLVWTILVAATLAVAPSTLAQAAHKGDPAPPTPTQAVLAKAPVISIEQQARIFKLQRDFTAANAKLAGIIQEYNQEQPQVVAAQTALQSALNSIQLGVDQSKWRLNVDDLVWEPVEQAKAPAAAPTAAAKPKEHK